MALTLKVSDMAEQKNKNGEKRQPHRTHSISMSELELDATLEPEKEERPLSVPVKPFSRQSDQLQVKKNKFYKRVDSLGRAKSLYGASPIIKFGPKASITSNEANVLTIQDPGSQRLKWYKQPLTVLVIRKMWDPTVLPKFIELVAWLISEKQMLVYLEHKSFHEATLENYKDFENIKEKCLTFKEGEDDIQDKVDFIICLGGDGTLLHASNLFEKSVPPIMAFHLGSLGFLMPFDFSNYKERVNEVLQGDTAVTLRTRLKSYVCRANDNVCLPVKNVESKLHIMALNEVVIDRGSSSFLCNIELYIEHQFVTSVQGDGLIISTPTGSTAYSAAAGASMVHPSVPAILITPICPHSLSFRPIIVPAGVEIMICISPESRNTAWVSFDGRERQEINTGDSVRIGTSIYPLPSICSKDQTIDWFSSLAGGLHWNQRRAQRRLDVDPLSNSESPSSSPVHTANHVKE